MARPGSSIAEFAGDLPRARRRGAGHRDGRHHPGALGIDGLEVGLADGPPACGAAVDERQLRSVWTGYAPPAERLSCAAFPSSPPRSPRRQPRRCSSAGLRQAAQVAADLAGLADYSLLAAVLCERHPVPRLETIRQIRGRTPGGGGADRGERPAPALVPGAGRGLDQSLVSDLVLDRIANDLALGGDPAGRQRAPGYGSPSASRSWASPAACPARRSDGFEQAATFAADDDEAALQRTTPPRRRRSGISETRRSGCTAPVRTRRRPAARGVPRADRRVVQPCPGPDIGAHPAGEGRAAPRRGVGAHRRRPGRGGAGAHRPGVQRTAGPAGHRTDRARGIELARWARATRWRKCRLDQLTSIQLAAARPAPRPAHCAGMEPTAPLRRRACCGLEDDGLLRHGRRDGDRGR